MELVVLDDIPVCQIISTLKLGNSLLNVCIYGLNADCTQIWLCYKVINMYLLQQRETVTTQVVLEERWIFQ